MTPTRVPPVLVIGATGRVGRAVVGDVAAVVARTLYQDGHAGGDYVLTGPESLSQAQQVSIIGDVLGRRIEFAELSPDEFRSETEGSWPRPVVDMLLTATEHLVDALLADSGVSNIVVLAGSARRPDGDAVQFDVLARSADSVLRHLETFADDRRGSITVDSVDAAIGEQAIPPPRHRLVQRDIAPVWDVVEAKIRSDAVYAPSFYILLAIAGLIGAVGILTNSQILIVGAMVVGPEYNAIMGIALGIDKRTRPPVLRGALALLAGFTAAIILTLIFGLVIRWSGHTPQAYLLGVRPVSSLIDNPNLFSLVVAVLAGIVGVVSLTEARSAALIGVFISVTTIPAAADTGLSIAYANWSEARGSALQLLLNVTVLIAIGAAGLRLQRIIWRLRAHPQGHATDAPGR